MFLLQFYCGFIADARTLYNKTDSLVLVLLQLCFMVSASTSAALQEWEESHHVN